MKILYVVPFIPWPVKVRSFNLIPRLARNHEIYLVCVSNTEPTKEQKGWLSKYCKEAVHVPHSTWKGMAQCVFALPTPTPLRIAYCRSKRAMEAVQRVYEEVQPDVVYVERWRALQYVPENAPTPTICDPTDSMTLYNRRLMEAGSWWEKLVGWEEYNKFLRFEGRLAQRADVNLFCSKVDMESVKQQAPQVEYEVVPNAVDCEKYFFKNEAEEEPSTVIFTGSFKYRPNYLAVKYFMEKIFPVVQREVPGAKFFAVGNGASHALRDHRGKAGFESVDFVPDLRPYLARATVAVAPLTVGSGVSNKLAEGFAVGTPMVATPLACGDLPVKSGEQLLVGGNAGEFAEHVVTLLRNASLRRRLAVCARKFVEEKYDWEIATGKLEAEMERLVSRRESSKQVFATA